MKTVSNGLDEFQVYSNNVFQPFSEDDINYGSSDSSLASPSDSLFLQA